MQSNKEVAIGYKMSIRDNLISVREHIPAGVTLVNVSKFHSADAIMQAYEAGERDFGESRVQELVTKYETLPKDIRWHFIGHLQTNKVRQIVPFVHLIQSVDSLHLMQTIEAEAARINRIIDVLLEVHVAKEQTKSGLTYDELTQLLSCRHQMQHVHICGIMGMATLTDDETEIRRCFNTIRQFSNLMDPLPIISMGMSDDYLLAIEEGSNMVRVGSAIFGTRNQSK